jgi:hypothetical protein
MDQVPNTETKQPFTLSVIITKYLIQMPSGIISNLVTAKGHVEELAVQQSVWRIGV